MKQNSIFQVFHENSKRNITVFPVDNVQSLINVPKRMFQKNQTPETQTKNDKLKKQSITQTFQVPTYKKDQRVKNNNHLSQPRQQIIGVFESLSHYQQQAGIINKVENKKAKQFTESFGVKGTNIQNQQSTPKSHSLQRRQLDHNDRKQTAFNILPQIDNDLYLQLSPTVKQQSTGQSSLQDKLRNLFYLQQKQFHNTEQKKNETNSPQLQGKAFADLYNSNQDIVKREETEEEQNDFKKAYSQTTYQHLHSQTNMIGNKAFGSQFYIHNQQEESNEFIVQGNSNQQEISRALTATTTLRQVKSCEQIKQDKKVYDSKLTKNSKKMIEHRIIQDYNNFQQKFDDELVRIKSFQELMKENKQSRVMNTWDLDLRCHSETNQKESPTQEKTKRKPLMKSRTIRYQRQTSTEPTTLQNKDISKGLQECSSNASTATTQKKDDHLKQFHPQKVIMNKRQQMKSHQLGFDLPFISGECAKKHQKVKNHTIVEEEESTITVQPRVNNDIFRIQGEQIRTQWKPLYHHFQSNQEKLCTADMKLHTLKKTIYSQIQSPKEIISNGLDNEVLTEYMEPVTKRKYFELTKRCLFQRRKIQMRKNIIIIQFEGVLGCVSFTQINNIVIDIKEPIRKEESLRDKHKSVSYLYLRHGTIAGLKKLCRDFQVVIMIANCDNKAIRLLLQMMNGIPIDAIYSKLYGFTEQSTIN